MDCTQSGVLVLTDIHHGSILSFDPRNARNGFAFMVGRRRPYYSDESCSDPVDDGDEYSFDAPEQIVLFCRDSLAVVMDDYKLRCVTVPEWDPAMFDSQTLPALAAAAL